MDKTAFRDDQDGRRGQVVRQRAALRATALWALLLFTGCKDSHGPSASPSAKPAAEPAPVKVTGNPYARDLAAIAAGRKIFMQNGCSGCHGLGGGGGMGKPLIDDEWRFGSDDETLFKLIRGKIPGQTMPNAIGLTLSDDQVWQVLAFVRTLYRGDPAKINWTPPPPGAGQPGGDASASVAEASGPTSGRETFLSQCAPCHGPGGQGDGPAAAALQPKPRDLTDAAYMSRLDDQYLSDLIHKGGAAMGKSALMPAQAALGEARIQAVIGYVRSLARPR